MTAVPSPAGEGREELRPPLRAARHWIAPLAGALMVVLPVSYFAVLAPYGLNIDDEGTLLYQIYRIYLGQLLYVDFHAGYTPGLFYWNAGLFSLFGVNVVVVRLCLALVNGLTVYCMYWLGRRLGAGGLSAAAAALLYLAFIPFYDGEFCAFNIPYPIWYVTLFWLLSVVCAVRWWEDRRGRWWLLAGICVGVVFAFKPNSGLLNLAALLIGLVLLERPAADASSRRGQMIRLIARGELALRWAIPVGLTLALALLFGRSAGRREVAVFALPLIVIVGYQFLLERARRSPRPVPPLTLLRNLTLLGVGFAVVTLPWTLYFWAQLGTRPFLRAVLFIGTGFDRFYYIAYPPIGLWSVALSLAMAALVGLSILLRRGVVAPRLVGGALLAGAALSGAWLLRHPPPMIEGFQSSVVMRVRDVCFIILLLTEWAALVAYAAQTWRGRAFSVAIRPQPSSRMPAVAAPAILMLLILSGVLMHMQLYPRTDFMHLVTAAPGILILGGWLLELLAQAWARGMSRSGVGRGAVAALVTSPVYVLVIVLMVPALLRIEYLARAWWARDPTARVRLHIPRAPLVLEPSAAGTLKALDRTIQYLRDGARPDEYVFTFPMIDILCFLSDRQNPTRHGYFYPGWPGHDVEAEVIDALRARPPSFIVTLHAHPLYFTNAPQYYFNLRRYVTSHYSFARTIGTFDILRRGTAAAAPIPAAARDSDLRKAMQLWRRELQYRHGAEARRVVAALSALSPADAATFAHGLGTLQPDVQRAVAQLIRKSRTATGATALAIVIENYTLPDPLERLMIRIISEIADARAVVPLLNALGNATAAQRQDLSGALYTIASKLSREEFWFAQADRRGLGGIAQVVRADDLIDWIDNPWEPFALRAFAVHVAGYQRDRKVVPFLVRVLGDPEELPELRVQAAASLEALGFGSQVLPAIISLMHEDTPLPAALTASIYARHPEVGRELLAEQMMQADEVIRGTAFWIAAGEHDAELRESLREGLHDIAPNVRMAAAWGLGNLGDRSSVPALQRAAADGDDQVARFAQRAVEKIEAVRR